MCGIAGIIGETQGGDIRRMARTLAHRGPDGEGFFLSRHAQLGHRLLKVIDLKTGQQPITTGDGRYTLVFNGEIYNFRDLKHELETYGINFRTRSDSEVLLEAYARWKRGALEKLCGMFAFAVWDSKEQALFAARDRLGVKPLYYATCGSTLLFGSEMKALLAHPGVDREIDDAALDDYLTYLYVPAPRTIFRQISELPPAHWIEWQDGRLSIGNYWDVSFQPEEENVGRFVEELKEVLEQAVSARLASEVPLGVFLSGGLDSSSIAALMARRQRAPIKALTIGFSDGGKWYDERAYARIVGEAIGADAREQTVEPPSANLLSVITQHFDEPFGNPTAVLAYQLAAAGRKNLTVALTGDGGDEALLGYPRYQGVALAEHYQKAPVIMRRTMAQAALHGNEPANGNHFRRRLREFLTSGVLPPERMYLDWVSYFSRELRENLYTPEFKRRLGGHDSSQFLVTLLQKKGAQALVDRVNYADLHSFLPYNVLRYSDRMSMAHSLEIRCPFTDHRLIEFLARVPWRHKLRITQSKRLLRQAANAWLPREIVSRPKLGLNPPMGLWMQSKLRSLLRSHLAPERIQDRGYFRAEAIQRLITDHNNGRRDYSLHLWALISFEQWHRQYLDSSALQQASNRKPACPTLQLA
jgi:asparagine synthase (glutamine-hydrolysing)